MGLEIGYYLYEKKPLDEENKFVEAKGIDASWVCGRCDVNYSWGELFKFEPHREIAPVFQKGLKDKKKSYDQGDFAVEFNLVDYDEFSQIVKSAIQEARDDAFEDKRRLLKEIKDLKNKKAELRGLQKECTEDNAFAFDRWSAEIADIDEAIVEKQAYLDEYDEEDYDMSHAKYVENLLKEMKERLDEDEYYVVPYYSY